MQEQSATWPSERIDHIILGINNLDSGIAQFEALTGVKPERGGEHPNRFSQNALVRLGPYSYLEIMAPKPGADSVPDWIKSMDSLTVAGWAIGVNDADATVSKLNAMGIETTPLQPGSRKTPDGKLLQWKTFGLEGKDDSMYPFFIEWSGDTKHPALSAPDGCTFGRFSIQSRDSVFEKIALRFGLSFGAHASESANDRIDFDLYTKDSVIYFSNKR